MSSIRSPKTVPWPHPVVVVFFAVFASRSTSPRRVFTATAFVSQSTCTATMSSMRSTRRWLRSQPIASASGAAPRVISVSSSLRST